MGNIINILPIEFNENSNEKFKPIYDFKDREWVTGNNYWFPILEKVCDVQLKFAESDTILFIIYNGQAESLLPQKQYFLDAKNKLDEGVYKKIIIFQNEVNWDTFERILDIEDYFYSIFKDDKRFLFVRNIFKSKFNFTKINAEFSFGCFPFQLLHNYNESINFDYNVEKKYHLFSANCNVKEERLHLYQFLEKGNFWNKSNVSFFLPLYGSNSTRFNIKDFFNQNLLLANIGPGNTFISNLGEIDLDINYHPKKLKYDNFHQVKNLALNDSVESLFQVIFETRYHSHCGLVLSEKIFKGFLYKTPFLIFAQYGVLKLLKELGFKTFDWLIDESYDYEPDDRLRLNLVFEEATKLFNTPIEVLNTVINEHSDIFEHNQKLVNELAITEINKICKLFDVQ